MRKKFFRIQELAFAEQFSGKFGADKIATIAGCPVQNENGIFYLSARVSLWGAESPIMDSQFRKNLARAERKILQNKIIFLRGWIICREGTAKRREKQSQQP